MDNPRFYRHSGRVPSLGTVALLAIVVLSALFAPLYSLGIWYIPFVKLRFVLVLVYGAAVAVIAYGMARVGKVRNTAVVVTTTLIAAAISYWIHWLVWLVIATKGYLFLNPIHMGRIILVINENGVWTMGKSGDPVNGVFLWILWAAEILTFFGISIFFMLSLYSNQVFCEGCEKWIKGARTLNFHPVADLALLRQQLEADNPEFISYLTPDHTEAAHYTRFTVQSCESCTGSTFLAVRDVNVTTTKKERSENVKEILPAMLVSRTLSDALIGLYESFDPAINPPAVADNRQDAGEKGASDASAQSDGKNSVV